jgi:hypothetical protein
MSSHTVTSQAWLRKQPDTTDSAVSAELEATTRAVIAAHDGPLREAVQRVRWERHGVLQRLRRTHRPLAAA